MINTSIEDNQLSLVFPMDTPIYFYRLQIRYFPFSIKIVDKMWLNTRRNILCMKDSQILELALIGHLDGLLVAGL